MIKLRTAAIVAGALIFGGSLIACGGNPSPGPTTPAPTHTATISPAVTHTPTRSPSPSDTPTQRTSPPSTTKAISAEQRNATKTAQEYLDGQSFSRTGLISQLKFEGYPTGAATAAVDSLNIDWNVQAANVAKDYLNGQPFSKKGLLSQLKFEGFSDSQAKYGVAHSGL